eukprot:jgi/Bigna1/71481/fgenesh1_pg.15_\
MSFVEADYYEDTNTMREHNDKDTDTMRVYNEEIEEGEVHSYDNNENSQNHSSSSTTMMSLEPSTTTTSSDTSNTTAISSSSSSSLRTKDGDHDGMSHQEYHHRYYVKDDKEEDEEKEGSKLSSVQQGQRKEADYTHDSSISNNNSGSAFSSSPFDNEGLLELQRVAKEFDHDSIGDENNSDRGLSYHHRNDKEEKEVDEGDDNFYPSEDVEKDTQLNRNNSSDPPPPPPPRPLHLSYEGKTNISTPTSSAEHDQNERVGGRGEAGHNYLNTTATGGNGGAAAATKFSLKKVFFAVMTSPQHEDQREALRNSWISRVVARGAVYKFFVGGLGNNPELHDKLISEKEREGDLILLPIGDGYYNLSRKTLGAAWWTEKEIFDSHDHHDAQDDDESSSIFTSANTDTNMIKGSNENRQQHHDTGEEEDQWLFVKVDDDVYISTSKFSELVQKIRGLQQSLDNNESDCREYNYDDPMQQQQQHQRQKRQIIDDNHSSSSSSSRSTSVTKSKEIKGKSNGGKEEGEQEEAIVKRKHHHKWAVPFRMFKPRHFPDYAEGPFYILSQNATRFLAMEFDSNLPQDLVFPLEDVNTAIILQKHNITPLTIMENSLDVTRDFSYAARNTFLLSHHEPKNWVWKRSACPKFAVAVHALPPQRMQKMSSLEDTYGGQEAISMEFCPEVVPEGYSYIELGSSKKYQQQIHAG